MQYKQLSILGPQRTQVQRNFRLRVSEVSLECKDCRWHLVNTFSNVCQKT